MQGAAHVSVGQDHLPPTRPNQYSPRPGLQKSNTPGTTRQSMVHRDSALICKQLNRVVEATHRILAHAFEIEIAFDEVDEGTGQQHRFS
jgi:hypothetical protein